MLQIILLLLIFALLMLFAEGYQSAKSGDSFGHHSSQARGRRRLRKQHQMWNPFAGGAAEPTGSAAIDAVLAKEPATLKAILVRNKSAADETDSDGNTALHIIAKRGHYQYPPEPEDSIPKLLIEAGANLNLKNKANRTSLEIALLSGWQRIAYLLLEKGADRSVVTAEVKSKITCPDCKRVVREYSL